MRLAVDTNVLVYAHVPGSKEHETVHGYLSMQLRKPRTTIVLTPLVLHEFVHVVTDSKRMEPALSMSEATAIAREYLDRANTTCVEVNESILKNTFDLLDRYELGRRRIADTLLVATLLHHDIRDIATCDPGGFALFGEIRVIDPRSARA